MDVNIDMNNKMKKILSLSILCLLTLDASAQASGGQIRRNEKKESHFRADKHSPSSSVFSRPTGVSEGHGYVDLGLSVMWALTNIGANEVKDTGQEYAWGETISKSTFNLSTYIFYRENNGLGKFTKYCSNSYYGLVDNKTIIEEIDDVSSIKWGSTWRIPSVKELEELKNECKWNETNGGWKIIGPNGNSIFLPYGGYWANEIKNDSYAYNLYWGNITGICRDAGQFVRPVLEKK